MRYTVMVSRVRISYSPPIPKTLHFCRVFWCWRRVRKELFSSRARGLCPRKYGTFCQGKCRYLLLSILKPIARTKCGRGVLKIFFGKNTDRITPFPTQAREPLGVCRQSRHANHRNLFSSVLSAKTQKNPA